MSQPISPPRRQKQQHTTPTAPGATTWDEAVDAFIATGTKPDPSPATIDNYTYLLTGPRSTAFRADHGIERPGDLTEDVLAAFRDDLLAVRRADGTPLSKATVHAFLNAHKIFVNFCLRMDRRDRAAGKTPRYGVEIFEVRDVESAGLPNENYVVFTKADEEKLLAAAAKKNPRDRMIVEFLMRTGLRLAEACNVELDDIKEGSYLLVRQGKGRKDRIVPLNTAGYDLNKKLQHFIRVERVTSTDPHLFLTTRKTGTNGSAGYTKMTSRAIQVMIRRLGDEVGVQANPHKFRHSFGTRAIGAGVDVFTLQRVMGHTTLDMVRKYVHQSDADLIAKWAKRTD